MHHFSTPVEVGVVGTYRWSSSSDYVRKKWLKIASLKHT